jgi:hypothetical protein
VPAVAVAEARAVAVLEQAGALEQAALAQALEQAVLEQAALEQAVLEQAVPVQARRVPVQAVRAQEQPEVRAPAVEVTPQAPKSAPAEIKCHPLSARGMRPADGL